MDKQPVTITINLDGKGVTVKLTEFLSRVIANEMFDANAIATIYYAAGYVSSEIFHADKEVK